MLRSDHPASLGIWGKMAKTLYFVTALSDAQKVRERIGGLTSEGDVYDLAADKWMVYYEGTGQELAEQAGIRGGDYIGSGLVLSVTTYSGRAPTTLWDWLKGKEG